LDGWFARAFSRNIVDRFQSAEEMAEALAAASRSPVDGPANEAPAEAPATIDASESPTWPFAPSVAQVPAPPASPARPSPRRLWAAPLVAVAVMLVVSTLGPRARSADLRAGRDAAVVPLAPELAPEARSERSVVASLAPMDAGLPER
jgi:hypothetical protein